MKQNVAGQEISAIMLDAAGAEVITGTTTVTVNKDGTPGTGGTASYSNGEWVFSPIQSDTNGAKVNFKFTNVGGPSVLMQVFTAFPQSVDNDTKISALPTAAEIWASGTRTLTSFGTLVADIWAYATRSLTDKLGFFISGTKTTLDDLNDLSVGDITGEVQTGVFARVAVTGDAIQIIKGNFKTLSIDLGAEWDLTGKFVYFVMSAQGSSVAPIVNREVDRITDAPNGLAEIDLLPAETTPEGCYEYQVEIRNDPADDEPETAMEGTAEITENLRSS